MVENREYQYNTEEYSEEPYIEEPYPSSNSSYQRPNYYQKSESSTLDGYTPTWKKGTSIATILIISALVIAGLTSDARYLLIIGLVFIALMLLSFIVSLFAGNRHMSIWEWFILQDLIRLFIYVVAIIFRLFAEIAKNN